MEHSAIQKVYARPTTFAPSNRPFGPLRSRETGNLTVLSACDPTDDPSQLDCDSVAMGGDGTSGFFMTLHPRVNRHSQVDAYYRIRNGKDP